MCYLAVYYPETKSFELGHGRKPREDQLFAIVHEDCQSSGKTDSDTYCLDQARVESVPYILDLGRKPTSFCKSCREIEAVVLGT